jgi:hypothetical protein
MTTDGLKEIADGIFKKNESTFYIKCAMSQKLCFCSAERLEKLAKKYGGMNKVSSNYVSRDAKRLKKAGLKDHSLKNMDPDELVEEARNLHTQKKLAKLERKEKRKIIEEAEVKEKVREAHVDPFLPTYSPEELEAMTPSKGCLRMTYRMQEGRCNECMYKNGCMAEAKSCHGELFAPKGFGGDAVKACINYFNKRDKSSCKAK